MEKLDGTYLSHPVYAERVKPTAIQTTEGKLIQNKEQLLQYLNTREDMDAEMLKKGLMDGKLKVVDYDGIQIEQDNSLMCLSIDKHANNGSSTEIIINDPGRPVSELTLELKAADALKQDNVIGKEGCYELTKARFKNGDLQCCLTGPDNKVKGRNAFWITVKESYLWDELLHVIADNKIRVIGNPMGGKATSINQIKEFP